VGDQQGRVEQDSTEDEQRGAQGLAGEDLTHTEKDASRNLGNREKITGGLHNKAYC